ncbi:hypothetical protein NLX83_36690 [Allokutzneria sp. A3M-2-11 16]|uniref:hypothetical protein n=1 Tax=Allokutzneria sp. A3M-2-11 16 TaxID=2962043 RepID=UPI0020B8252A|nr:hypothetical protein [Allokutzneria sp. A3M-2-11 16]MCP3804819.1 hypothetical protein [Allokutzneria sp. A3M-2-11 16]
MQHKNILAVVCVAAFAVTGCGATVGQPSAAEPPSSLNPTSSVNTTTERTTTAAAPDSSLTPTGSTLTVGQAAKVRYSVKTLSKETTTLEVTAVSAKKGAISDLKNFELDASSKNGEPYYVTMKFRNIGPTAMEPGGIFGLIEALNPAGDEMSRLTLLGKFRLCEGDSPESLAVGASYTECGVYIAPAGQRLDKVVFDFYVDLDRTQITWSGPA